MSRNTQMKKVLYFAIGKEESARIFYVDLARRVLESSTQETLEYLAGEEAKHKEFLEQYLKGEIPEGALQLTDTVNYKILEHLEEDPEPSETLKPEDAFLLAAKREKGSYEFYKELSEIHPDGEARRLLETMARQELRHKEKVEYLYANTAFPQTAGG